MLTRRMFFWITLALAPVVLKAQTAPDPANYTGLVSILPPSPNASSLGKYGGIDLNLSSGALNLSVPIYSFSSINLSVPLSLSYNSNSIRIDEIAPSVGQSWALNAGGVITRTVYGMPDGDVPRMAPPSDFPNHTYGLLQYLEDITIQPDGNGTRDAQPDLFSFNYPGGAGRFIVDSSLNPILLTYTGDKIESQLSVGSHPWNFRITTPAGVQYLFGGDSAIEWAISQQIGPEAGRVFLHNVPTAYYLRQIIHPNNDTITFSYTGYNDFYNASINESMQSVATVAGTLMCESSPAPSRPTTNPKSVTQITISGLLVRQISSTCGTKAIFSYIDRTDKVGSLLSSIDIYQPDSAVSYKRFSFNYTYGVATNFFNSYSDTPTQYRPFLTTFVEHSPDSTLRKVYHFTYDDINALPPRLSYAQDHYGYFNGKTNSTLCPAPKQAAWLDILPDATANREVDSNYCLKGLLTKITYPTGGSDTIVYEANRASEPVVVVPPDTTVTISATSTTRLGGPTASYTLQPNFDQSVLFSGFCTFFGDPGDEDDLHDITAVNIYDNTDPGSPVILFSQNVHAGDGWSFRVTIDSGKSYLITLQPTGVDVSTQSTFRYNKGHSNLVYMDQLVGGNRVKRVTTHDPVSNVDNIKRYFYTLGDSVDSSGLDNVKFHPPQNNSTSSGIVFYSPQYERVTTYYTSCTDGGLPSPFYSEFGYATVYSNTQNNIYGFSSSPISYRKVRESFGENFENGGVEHDFTVAQDNPGNALLGDFILNGPRTNYSWLNGREIHQRTFNSTGATVKEVFTHYAQDSRVSDTINSYMLNNKFINQLVTDPPQDYSFHPYDLLVYSYLRKWIYPDSIITWTFDKNGVNHFTDTTVTAYGNPVHALPTQLSSTLSDGRRQIVSNAYPNDLTLSGDAETARQALVTRHIFSPVLQQTVAKGSSTVYVGRTDYSVFASNLVLPRRQNIQIGTNTGENRVEMTSYNNSGQLTTQSKENDQPMSYIRDYRSMYLTAQVANADSVNIAYTSFEADGTGNWTLGSSVTDPSIAVTGARSYNLSNGACSRSGLSSSTTYIVSYWSHTGSSYSVAGTFDTKQGRTYNGWTYFEHRVSGVSSVSVSGSGNIDELRLYPLNAQMTTYTYIPLIGISSQCDVNNRVTYYEYDGLGRLSVVKDQDGNVVKTYDYHYNEGTF